MAGKDCLVRAKTGSGKTLAFALGALQKLLSQSAQGGMSSGVRALVLVPTKELVLQTVTVFESLMEYCPADIDVVGLGAGAVAEQASALQAAGAHIVVATPGRAVAHIKKGSLQLTSSLEMLVVDEADLVLSYGYRGDMEKVIAALPQAVQSFLLSATLSEELEDLKRLVLRAPAVVKLNDDAASTGYLSQFYIMVPEEDKALLLFALIKLRLISGKTIMFVNDVDKCYRLKLFFERFSIPAAVLNAELPANSRNHIVQQFNKGLFDFLIATDGSVGVDGAVSEAGSASDSDEDESGDDSDGSASPSAAAVASGAGGGSAAQRTKRRRTSDAAPGADSDDEDAGGHGVAAEAGVTRGVDFKGVTTVVNVDFPQSVSAYIHRIGRTARGGAAGAALSFVGTVGAQDVKVLAAVQGTQPRADSGAPEPSLLPFDRTEVSSFRYRVEGVLRSITRKSVKEARMTELRSEILASNALQAHFEDNPVDLDLLRHDKSLQPDAVRPELADIPAYLLPESLRAVVETANGDTGGRRRRKGKKRGREEGNPKALKTYADQKAADDAVTAGAATSDGARVPSVRQHAEGGVRSVPTSIYGLPSVRRQSDLLLSNRNKWKRDHKLGAWGKGGKKGGMRKKKGARPF